MIKPSQSTRRSKAQGRLLADLAARFKLFRAEHPARTRIPAELRATAVAARRSVGEVHRR